MYKRGLSEIVITVLLVLISIVAVLVFWQIIRGVLTNSSSQMDTQKVLVSMSIQKVTLNQSSGDISVNIKRDNDQGNFNMMRIVLDNGTTAKTFDFNAANFGSLESKNFNFNFLGNITNVADVSIAPVLKKDDGSLDVGVRADLYKITGKETSSSGTCNNLCSSAGTLSCSGNSVQNCTDTNSDGCLELSTINTCSAGSTCYNGICTSQTCSDGTAYGSCNSTNKPKYCNNNGQLIDNCSYCGCSSGTCNSTGQCQASSTPTDYYDYWKFEGGISNPVTDKTGKNNLTIFSLTGNYVTPAPYHSCVSGTNCFQYFEGSAFSVVYNNGITGESKVPYSISFWVNPTNFSTQRRIALTYASGSNIYSQIDIYNSTVWVRGGTDMSDGASLNAPIKNNSWTHIVITYDGAAYGTLYVNGTSIGTKGFTLGSYGNPTSLYVGANSYYLSGTFNGPSFNGALDELLIYNRTLTPGEVSALYTANYNNL